MSTDILEKAKQQRMALEDDIEAKQREIVELDQFIRTYKCVQDGNSIQTQPAYRSAKDRILTTLQWVLSDHRSRRVKELFAELTNIGIEIGGKTTQNKLTNLAALLCRDARFKFVDRKTGWSLVNTSAKGSEQG